MLGSLPVPVLIVSFSLEVHALHCEWRLNEGIQTSPSVNLCPQQQMALMAPDNAAVIGLLPKQTTRMKCHKSTESTPASPYLIFFPLTFPDLLHCFRGSEVGNELRKSPRKLPNFIQRRSNTKKGKSSCIIPYKLVLTIEMEKILNQKGGEKEGRNGRGLGVWLKEGGQKSQTSGRSPPKAQEIREANKIRHRTFLPPLIPFHERKSRKKKAFNVRTPAAGVIEMRFKLTLTSCMTLVKVPDYSRDKSRKKNLYFPSRSMLSRITDRQQWRLTVPMEIRNGD